MKAITIDSTSLNNDVTIDLGDMGDCWITVNLGPGRPSASVKIASVEEGLLIDVWPGEDFGDEPVGSTYVVDSELTQED